MLRWTWQKNRRKGKSQRLLEMEKVRRAQEAKGVIETKC